MISVQLFKNQMINLNRVVRFDLRAIHEFKIKNKPKAVSMATRPIFKPPLKHSCQTLSFLPAVMQNPS